MFKFAIYGQPNCKDCEIAKTLITEKGYQYNYIDITTVEGYKAFRNVYAASRTVPQITLLEPFERIGTIGELRDWLKAFTPKS